MLFNEPKLLKSQRRNSSPTRRRRCFSALQRAEIAEIEVVVAVAVVDDDDVSVLLNEPKLLKLYYKRNRNTHIKGFSALQRAEIAEMTVAETNKRVGDPFQCSSTSRNC